MAEWIKCSEQMPPDIESCVHRMEAYVLLWNADGGDVEYGVWDVEVGHYWVDHYYRAVPKEYITHWMPKPEGPDSEML